MDTEIPVIVRRAEYAARTVEAACFLASGCPGQGDEIAILRRATQMLQQVWSAEVETLKSMVQPGSFEAFNAALKAVSDKFKVNLIAVEVEAAEAVDVKFETLHPHTKMFWDLVISYIAQVKPTSVHNITAVYDETVNPNNEHNVYITVQPANIAATYVFDLKCP